jgi:hypothetical protein
MTFKACKLQPGTSYSFKVAAHNAEGMSAFSDAASITTALKPPEPPTDISATPVLQGMASSAAHSSRGHPTASIVVMWTPPQPAPATADVASYDVEATPVADASSAAHGKAQSQQAVRVTAGKVAQCELPGLQAGGHYSVRVRAGGADSAGHGNWSEAAIVQLPAPPVHSTDGDSDAVSSIAGDGALVAADKAARRKGKKGSSAVAEAAGQQQQQQKSKRKNSKVLSATSVAVAKGPASKLPAFERLLRAILPAYAVKQLKLWGTRLMYLVVALLLLFALYTLVREAPAIK